MKIAISTACEGFWPGFAVSELGQIFPALSEIYDFKQCHEPDLVWASVFATDPEGIARRYPNAKRVFFTGENRPPPLDYFDACLSFYRDIDDPRHLRWPLFLPHIHRLGFTIEDLVKNTVYAIEHVGVQNRSRFSCFIASNPNSPVRNRFVERLSAYKTVDCPGLVMNNMSSDNLGPPGDALSKIAFMTQYRYAVCFENTSTRLNEGYVTEKIIDAMLAGCIPLYWGDHRVSEDFNSDSFIDLTPFGEDVEAMVQHVVDIDQSRERVEFIRRSPWLPGNQPAHWMDARQVLDFLTACEIIVRP